MSATSHPPEPRSLADALRRWTPTHLGSLLRARPDLAVPTPKDLGQLTSRACGRASVQAALDALTTAELQVLTVAVICPEPTDAEAIAKLWGIGAADRDGSLAPALDRLRELALIWGERELHVVRTVREILGVHPAGLGPPLAEALDRRSPERLAGLLEDLHLPATGDPATASRLSHKPNALIGPL